MQVDTHRAAAARRDPTELDRATAAARRWRERTPQREAKSKALAEGRVTDADSPERLQLRLDRLAEWTRAALERRGAAPGRPGSPAAVLDEVAGRAELTDAFVERVIGKASDLLSIEFFELGLLAARCVGRIVTWGRPHGTGFVVAPGLVLTNEHVLPEPSTAAASTFELDYEDNRVGTPKRVEAFRMLPDTFFWADPALDCALVAVAPASEHGTELDAFGMLPLVVTEGKAHIGEAVNIVQHPGGGPKQVVIRNNCLVDLPEGRDMEQYFHYQADTSEGSSGAPVLNDQWEVVALHHCGVPLTNARNEPVDRHGAVLHRGDDPGRFIWVANEGIRVSRIVTALREVALPPAMARVRDEALAGWAVRGRPAVRERAGDRVERSLATPDAAVPAPRAADGAPRGEFRERVAPDPTDPDYRHRGGYDATFLGVDVPLPRLVDDRHGPLATADGDAGELRYHHYSVLMNARRRLAYVAAVNIDSRAPFHHEREGRDRWFLDPRLPARLQADDAYYEDNPLDRGHLVRRDDAAWGESPEEARLANDDTFHWTNCSPQHEIYNQASRATQRGLMLWGGLEVAVSRLARNHGGRLAVFNGPVFTDADHPYRQGFWVPREYWKLIVVRDADRDVRAVAFRLSQAEQIADLGPERFEPAELAAYAAAQIPVADLEQLTGLDFGPARGWDALAASPGRRLAHESDIAF